MTTPPPMVLVEWEDIYSIDTEPWIQNTPIKKIDPCIFQSIGFLIFQDENHIVLSACWSKELIGPRDQYPIGCVRSITVLNP